MKVHAEHVNESVVAEMLLLMEALFTLTPGFACHHGSRDISIQLIPKATRCSCSFRLLPLAPEAALQFLGLFTEQYIALRVLTGIERSASRHAHIDPVFQAEEAWHQKGDLASQPDLDQDRRILWEANLVKQHMMTIAQISARGFATQSSSPEVLLRRSCELDKYQMVCAFGSCRNLHTVSIAIQQGHRNLQIW